MKRTMNFLLLASLMLATAGTSFATPLEDQAKLLYAALKNNKSTEAIYTYCVKNKIHACEIAIETKKICIALNDNITYEKTIKLHAHWHKRGQGWSTKAKILTGLACTAISICITTYLVYKTIIFCDASARGPVEEIPPVVDPAPPVIILQPQAAPEPKPQPQPVPQPAPEPEPQPNLPHAELVVQLQTEGARIVFREFMHTQNFQRALDDPNQTENIIRHFNSQAFLRRLQPYFWGVEMEDFHRNPEPFVENFLHQIPDIGPAINQDPLDLMINQIPALDARALIRLSIRRNENLRQALQDQHARAVLVQLLNNEVYLAQINGPHRAEAIVRLNHHLNQRPQQFLDQVARMLPNLRNDNAENWIQNIQEIEVD